ncbi:MAG: universal stress protein [Alphaproteobacteria bacterium]
MPAYRLILCPVDFSKPSERALETGLDLATRLKAAVRVMHVFQLPATALPEVAGDGLRDMEDIMQSRLQEKLDALVKRIAKPGVEISTGLSEGVPYVEIARGAKAMNADLIVIGTHGRTGLAHMMLGSVAERVVRISEVPVLTVRTLT